MNPILSLRFFSLITFSGMLDMFFARLKTQKHSMLYRVLQSVATFLMVGVVCKANPYASAYMSKHEVMC